MSDEAASGTLASATQSVGVVLRGDFNITLSGTFVATVALERSFDLGATWNRLTYADGSPLAWLTPVSTPFTEVEAGVLYRFDCTSYTSGTVVWRLSQSGDVPTALSEPLAPPGIGRSYVDTAVSFKLDAAGGPPFGQNDINPRFHLSRLASPGTKTVVFFGDSTSTEVPASNYTVDPTQTICGALRAEFTRRNPHCRFTFINRGIPGANWAHPMMTANQSGTTQAPSWYTDRDKVWLDYARDDGPDKIFIILGTNSPSSGLIAGASVASLINDVLTYIGTWTKKPNITIITNKIANPGAGSPYSDDQEAYKAMASFLRTFALTNGKGYNGFPSLKYFGLVDLGRHYAARALGKDISNQYLQKVPSVLQTFTLAGPFTTNSNTIGATTDGDLRLTLVFPGAGGTVMYGVCAATGFYIQCSAFVGNRIHVTLLADGTWTARYQLIGTDSAPVVTGTSYKPPAGDVTMTVTLKREVIRITLNDTIVMDAGVPRLISNYNVTIGSAVTPVGSQSVQVTEFYEGIGAPAFRTLDPATAFGAAGGPEAGNDINHPSSSTVALIDWQVIAATNWCAPDTGSAEDDMGQIYATVASKGNTAVANTEEVLQTAPVLGGQLFNLLDALEVEAAGDLSADTNLKTIFLRLGGLGGAAMVTMTSAIASGTRWRANATIIKSGAGTQFYDGAGSVTASGNTGGTANGIANLDDTAPIFITVSGMNAVAAAGSVTCDMLRVKYLKAPGA